MNILAATVFCFCFLAQALLAQVAIAEQPNPFGEGTATVVLTSTEKASLLEYADNSKARLEKALSDAEGLSFE